MNGNLFVNLENKFKAKTDNEITQLALESLAEIFDALSGFDDGKSFQIALVAAKIGVGGDGEINEKEKSLIDNVLGKVWTGPMQLVYDFLNCPIEDFDYALIQSIVNMGNQFAEPFLNFMFCFAYIDNELECDVAEKLESIFGITLLMHCFQSDD